MKFVLKQCPGCGAQVMMSDGYTSDMQSPCHNCGYDNVMYRTWNRDNPNALPDLRTVYKFSPSEKPEWLT